MYCQQSWHVCIELVGHTTQQNTHDSHYNILNITFMIFNEQNDFIVTFKMAHAIGVKMLL